MNERGAAEGILAFVGIAMTSAEKLMESEGVKIFALDAFTKLAEIEMALLMALGFNAGKAERNPLARRARLGR